MNDRDHFAAAALTALLAAGEDCVDPYMASMCERAYEWADAMLREREESNADSRANATNHDPEPAGKAQSCEVNLPQAASELGNPVRQLTQDGTGNTQEPVAWVAFAADGSGSSVYSLFEQARAAACEWNWCIAPLYRSPTLTDEEREAVNSAAHAYEDHDDLELEEIAATLRKLLKRLA
jgi:hypothetical protein